MSQSMVIHLDSVYTDRSTSNILTVNRKLFDSECLKKFSQTSPMSKSILYQTKDYTLLRYYENGDEYLPHHDDSSYTAITFFYREPKSFEGGELLFPDFDYTFKCNNNHVILFPGCISHSVTKVQMNDNIFCNGMGRYSMAQFLTLN
jgi:Rps23 Pro-64 3,4-dihydroxylase Tpa1-like proline 4-hydroxylase